jgi:VanZ family protein
VRPFLHRWGPALLWAAAVFAVSSRPTLPHLPSVLGWDKLQHCAAYAVGGALIARALGAGPRQALLAALLGSLYGVSDEVHQLFVRNRNSDVVDWAADTLGVLAGVGLWHLYHHLHHARPRVAATDR